MGRRAEYAKGRIFAQSGDDDWAKPAGPNGDMFLFVVSPGKQKSHSLRLCGE